jgi:hypothetical protein
MSRAPLRPRQVAAFVLLVLFAGRLPAGGLEAWIQSFAQSEFPFKRLQSNAPLPPVAWLNVSKYGSTEFSSPPGEGAPTPLGRREQRTRHVGVRDGRRQLPSQLSGC